MKGFQQFDGTIRLKVLERLPDASPLKGMDLESLVLSENIPLECWFTILGSQMLGNQIEKAVLLAGARFLNHLSRNGTFPDPNFSSFLSSCADNMILDIPLNAQTYRAVRGALDREAYNYWTGRFLEEAGMETSLEDYLSRQSMHTGSRYATAIVVGVLLETQRSEILDATGLFGHHAGMGIALAQQRACLSESSDADHLTLPLLWVRSEKPDQWQEISGLIKTGDLFALKHELHAIGADILIAQMMRQQIALAQNALQKVASKVRTATYLKALELVDDLFGIASLE